jgi:uncharacterized DUF497 family protein
VNIEFDDAKSRRNARECGLPFGRAADFEWETQGEREGGEEICGNVRTLN